MVVDSTEDVDFIKSNLLEKDLWLRHFLAGGVAGTVSRTITAPLDRLKIFMQVSSTKYTLQDCFRMMMEDGGVRGMWRGNFINVLKITPETAIKFATYDYFKRLIKRNKETELHAYERFLSGSFAGIISQSVIYPLEVLKTRLVLRKTGQYTGIVNAAFAIYRNEGPRTFYKGFTANIIGITLFAGIDFTLYEALKKFLLPPKLDNWSISMLLICGGLSSTCGELIAYPFALCRTKLQADTTKLDKTHPTTMTMGTVFKDILRNDGFLGLYRGLLPNIIKAIPAVSISYVIYESVGRALNIKMA